MLEPRPDTLEDLSHRLDALGSALRAQEPARPSPALESLVMANARSLFVQRCILTAAIVGTIIVILALSWRPIFGTIPSPKASEPLQDLPTIEFLRRLNPDASVDALRLPPSRSGGTPAAPGPRDTIEP